MISFAKTLISIEGKVNFWDSRKMLRVETHTVHKIMV